MGFLSNRKFKLWGYTVSHCSLLLRSPMLFPDEDGYSKETDYNIDIEFWGVEYINTPTLITNISIAEISKEHLSDELKKMIISKQSKVFEIVDQYNKYYIIAGGVLVGKNYWLNQDRILNYDANLNHDIILFSV